MKILITGAKGFVGRNLAEALKNIRDGKDSTRPGVRADEIYLYDADTPADYAELLSYHNAHLMRPELSVSLAREKSFFDEKTAMLLELVDETSSVRLACQRMQISYSTGWNIIRTMESQFSRTLIERSQGGAGGGMSNLTEDGKLLLERFEAYSEALREQAGALFDQYFEGLFG
jgi:molybdate transport repressor ModE-like protein